MWKRMDIQSLSLLTVNVSVPLRGLDMWKLPSIMVFPAVAVVGFSPLAGIRYVETWRETDDGKSFNLQFQSPCGD